MATTTTTAPRRRARVIASTRETITETMDVMRVGAKTVNLMARANFLDVASEIEEDALADYPELYPTVESYRLAIALV